MHTGMLPAIGLGLNAVALFGCSTVARPADPGPAVVAAPTNPAVVTPSTSLPSEVHFDSFRAFADDQFDHPALATAAASVDEAWAVHGCFTGYRSVLTPIRGITFVSPDFVPTAGSLLATSRAGLVVFTGGWRSSSDALDEVTYRANLDATIVSAREGGRPGVSAEAVEVIATGWPALLVREPVDHAWSVRVVRGSGCEFRLSVADTTARVDVIELVESLASL